MSKQSEEAFDELVKRAQTKQTIELYLLAVMPDGSAFNVTNELMPEALEEVGQIRSFKDPAEAMSYFNQRGENLARLMTRVINPMAGMLFEVMLRKDQK